MQAWSLEPSSPPPPPCTGLPTSVNEAHVPLHIQTWLPAGSVLFPWRRKLPRAWTTSGTQPMTFLCFCLHSRNMYHDPPGKGKLRLPRCYRRAVQAKRLLFRRHCPGLPMVLPPSGHRKPSGRYGHFSTRYGVRISSVGRTPGDCGASQGHW